MRDVIASYQSRCSAAIRHYDGFVAKYMGDGILVYFGYPRAHEDDAERSVRAGLDIVEAMAELNAAAAPEVCATSAERRQLTVMFCDLVGSTALSARLDPEDLRAVIGVRREKAALSSGCKAHPAIRSSRKQSEQSWR